MAAPLSNVKLVTSVPSTATLLKGEFAFGLIGGSPRLFGNASGTITEFTTAGPEGPQGPQGISGTHGTSWWAWGTASNMTNISQIPGMAAGDYVVNVTSANRTILGVSEVQPGQIVKSTSATTAASPSGSILGPVGPAGTSGVDGAQGPAGTNGASWWARNGTTSFTNISAISGMAVGDYVVNTSSGVWATALNQTSIPIGGILKALTATTGQYLGSIRGATGETGAPGQNITMSTVSSGALATVHNWDSLTSRLNDIFNGSYVTAMQLEHLRIGVGSPIPYIDIINNRLLITDTTITGHPEVWMAAGIINVRKNLIGSKLTDSELAITGSNGSSMVVNSESIDMTYSSTDYGYISSSAYIVKSGDQLARYGHASLYFNIDQMQSTMYAGWCGSEPAMTIQPKVDGYTGALTISSMRSTDYQYVNLRGYKNYVWGAALGLGQTTLYWNGASVSVSSEAKHKGNIEEASSVLSKINQAKIYEYEWDVSSIAVDGSPDTINAAAIQKSASLVEELSSQLAELESSIEAVEGDQLSSALRKKEILQMDLEINQSVLDSNKMPISKAKSAGLDGKRHVGLVIGEGYGDIPEEVLNDVGTGIDLYALGAMAWKGIQELSQVVSDLKAEIQAMKE